MSKNPYDPFAVRIWQLGHGCALELGPKSKLMGILNVTPDSFSDGGHFVDLNTAIDHASRMITDGADIIDIGGESTKPGAAPVSEQLEQDRVLPVIGALVERFDILVSIDSYKSQTAQMALDAGAHMVNDVWGLQRDKNMAGVISEYRAGICIMHTSRDRELADDLVDDQKKFLSVSLKLALEAGIDRSHIILDPGLGFGKNAQDNLNLLRRFGELSIFEFPLLAGASRKRFTGGVLDKEDCHSNRDIVTSATSVIARMAGCSLFRVHDIKTNKFALSMADAVISSGNID